MPRRRTDAPAQDAVTRLRAAVTAVVESRGSDAPVAVALSGGRDSMALLDAAVATRGDHRVVALHVHHGLSPSADRWAAFCDEACRQYGVALRVERVSVQRANRKSLEATARDVRYAALCRMARDAGAADVLLAHHQDDQAETLLLQLFRGAGPRGLGAMPAARDIDGVRFLRPLLDLPRATIDAYVDARALAHVDDESNASIAHRRNAVRTLIAPAIRTLAPGYPATIARSAAHQREASLLLDELAAEDARAGFDGRTLARTLLRELAPHRARNVLRWYLRSSGLAPASAARLDAMLTQLRSARDDARVTLSHHGASLGIFRGRIAVHAPPPPAYECAWSNPDDLQLPHGTLGLQAHESGRLDARKLFADPVVVRSRGGGERLALRPGASRSLKRVLCEAALPVWERDALPLVYAAGRLVAVPGIGVDPDFTVRGDEPGRLLVWQPFAPGRQPASG